LVARLLFELPTEKKELHHRGNEGYQMEKSGRKIRRVVIEKVLKLRLP
jgi:hypothetical protein